MNDQLWQTTLLGGAAGFLIWSVVWSIRKSRKTGRSLYQTTEDLNDGWLSKWSIRMAIFGVGLGIFAAFAKGFTDVGLMIGFSIGLAFFGLVVGFFIDLLISVIKLMIKPKSTKIQEAPHPSEESVTQILETINQRTPAISIHSLSSQSTEEDIWAFASREMNSANRNEGLWAMSFATADGNADRAKAEYLKNRVDQLRRHVQEMINNEKRLAELAEAKRIADLGLPATCPKCGGEIRTTTEACNHCNAWLGAGSKDKPTPKY